MRRSAALAALAFGLALAGAARAETIDQVFDAFAKAMSRTDEETAPAWPDVTPAAIAQRKAALVALQKRLDAVPVAGLSEDQLLSRELMRRKIAIQLGGFAFDEERIPFRSGEGFFDAPSYAANLTVIRSAADAEKWLRRIETLPAYYEANIANMRRGIATGFVQPRLIAEVATRSIRTGAELPVASDPLLKPLAKLPPTMPAAEQEAFRARALTLVETKAKPARQALLTFMEREYLPKARTTLGARELPGGEAYYRYTIRRHTLTDMTPEQVHALGLAEIARIQGEMRALLAKSGYKGRPQDYIREIRDDPANYAKSVPDYVMTIAEAGKRADEALPMWFGKLPRLTWGIYIKPPEQANSSGGYSAGDARAGVAGHVTMSPRNVTTNALYSLPGWTFHEGVPGHHLQIALAQENDVPAFRRRDDTTVFTEGWGLYSERLAEEMGLYRSDKERFGKLSWEIWRACRLVMDTGVHWMGWTRDQARQCLSDNTALSPLEMDYETNRYIGWPGQALAYKIGEIRIRQIRAKAEKALGAKFDIRHFHDAVLGGGPMPMDLLEKRIDAWVAAGGK